MSESFDESGAPDWAEIRRRLAEKGDFEVKSYTGKAKQEYSYIDARDVMDRLDAVVGPGNWSAIHDLWDRETGAVRCTLSVYGVPKTDVGYPNNPIGATNKDGQRIDSDEALKEACSDALKRSAVLWGIGRFLYQDAPKGQPSARKDGRGAPRPASEKQINYLRRLSGNNGVPLPNGGNLDGLPMDIAARWIDEFTTKGAQANLSGWGEAAQGNGGGGGESIPWEPEQSGQVRQVNTETGEVTYGGASKASPDSPASPNQIATIVKLSRLLGQPEDIGEDMTSADASAKISELSREYNDRKATAARRPA